MTIRQMQQQALLGNGEVEALLKNNKTGHTPSLLARLRNPTTRAELMGPKSTTAAVKQAAKQTKR